MADEGRTLIAELIERGVQLRKDGQQLRLRAPPGTLDAKLREALVQHKQALLQLIGDDDGLAPLGDAQQQIWFAEQLTPTTRAHIVEIRAALRGQLDGSALRRALNAIITRHELLRARVRRIRGLPVLAFRAAEPQPIEAQRNDAPFDLTTGPLFRIALVRRAQDQHQLVIRAHHLIFDGSSVRLLLDELSTLYNAFRRGLPSPLTAELGHSYRDILLEQHKVTTSAPFERRLARRVAELTGSRATCLPADDGHAARPPDEWPMLPLSDPVVAQIRALARHAHTTPSSVVSAALALILSRLSGAEDITLGVPLSGRHTPERAATIGMLVDTSVLRLQVDRERSFRDLLQHVSERMLQVQAHGDVPLHRIAARLDAHRAGAPRQLFDIMLNYIALPPPALQLDGLTTTVSEHMGGSRFGATLYAYDQRGHITLRAAHDPQRYATSRMDELLAQLAGVLEQIGRQPELPLSQISLHTPSTPSAPSTRATQAAATVSATLEASTARHADRSAMLYRDQPYSYRQLHRASATIADMLARSTLPPKALGPNTRVALLAPRSPAFIAALLGIWRAGCSLVVLDPAHPVHHLNAELAAARPQLLLCYGPPPSGLDLHAAGAPIRLIPLPDLDPAQTSAASETEHELPTARTQFRVQARVQDGEAYVAFTSGTTTRPRAIHAGHAPLDHFFDWYRRTFTIEPSDRFAMLSGLSHDPLLRDVLAPLLSGAMVLIPPQAPALMGPAIGPWLQRTGATVLHTTPTLAQLILLGAQSHGITDLGTLRYIFFGGEALRGELARAIADLAPQAQLINLYGATETPQAVSFHILDEQDFEAPIVSIGHGIDDTELCVLDPSGRDAGLGELGEIHVRTRYLSRGYLNDADNSRRNFVAPDVYRTGDLGRLRLDGGIDFVGRADRQLKIRGVRIEPEAIEALLAKHPAVGAAAVVVRQDDSGTPSMSVHVERTAALNRTQLRDYLAARLPPSMLPAQLLIHETLPLTPRGKIDRQRLSQTAADDLPPAIAKPSQTTAGSHLLPLVGALWQQTLGLPHVAPDDHFFELGGHSLAAARLAARLNEQLSIQIPLRLLFEEPTLAGFCRRLSNLHVGARALPRLPVNAPLPLSFAQQRLWYIEQLADKAPPYHIVQTTRIRGRLDLDALDRALVYLEQRHEALRMRFVEDTSGVHLQLQAARESMLELGMLELGMLELGMLELGTSVTTDPARLSLSGGPLWRATCTSHGSQEHTLRIVMHHAISDGWSMRLFNQELAVAYQAFRQGTEPALPALGLRYVDYAHGQRQCMQGDFVAEQRRYWQRQLAGLQPIELPSRGDAPARRKWRAGSHTLTLSSEPWQRLRSLAASESATPFMVLYAGLLALLTRYCGTTDIAIGTPHSQRPSLAAEQLIGLFLNVVVLRTSSAGDPSYRQLLQRARETALAAWTHAELPFEQVVAAAAPPRAHGRQPLFRVFLNVMEGPLTSLQLTDTQCARVAGEIPPARVDLTVYAITEPDRVQLRLVYAEDLFDAEQIERMGGHLRALLEHVAQAPDTIVSALPLQPVLGPARTTVPVAPVAPEAIVRPDHAMSLSAQLEKIAQMHAARPAVIDSSGHSTSYVSLFAHVHEVAAQLHEQLPAQGHVGLLLTKDASMLVGMLACLMAGRPYVPLTPDLPQQRLRTMCQDAQLDGLLCCPPLRPLAQQLADEDLVLLEIDPRAAPATPWPAQQKQPAHQSPTHESTARHSAADQSPANQGTALPSPSDEQLAYILYTSGSTGRPKGVMQSRAGLLRHARNYIERLAIIPQDRLSLLSTYAFDAAIMDIFGACLSGAALCPIQKHELPALWETLQQRRITIYHSTPTVFRHLLSSAALIETTTAPSDPEPPLIGRHSSTGPSLISRHNSAPEPPILGRNGTAAPHHNTPSSSPNEPNTRLDHIRWVVLGGEEVRPADLHGFEQHFPRDCRFINGLGPTECTLALQWELDRSKPRPTRQVPVGRAVPGIQVSLQASTGPQVARYGSGEIILSGPQVALGYWRRPELTARAFSTLPNGSRQYRSGDMGRWLANGSLSFIGRNDDQLKLRGYRVEPGEIVDCLRAHERVSAATVLVSGEGSDAQLVAHVAGDSISAAMLRTWCAAVLPPWQVPAAFMVHDELPATATGKVDRRALAAFKPPREQPRHSRPPDAIQQQLASLWTELLGVSAAVPEDDFFAQGGHSLLALTLIQRVKHTLGVEVPLPSFLEEPTMGALSNMIAAGGMPSVTRRRARVMPMQDGQAPLLLLVTPPGARASLYRSLAAHWQGAVVALEPPGFGSRGPLPTLEQLAARCRAALATQRLHPHAPTLGDRGQGDPLSTRAITLAGFSHGGVLAFELARQLERAGSPVRRLVLLDSFAPQTLRAGTATRNARAISFAMALIGQAPPTDLRDSVLSWLLEQAQRSGQLHAGATLREIEAMFEHFCAHAERGREAIRAYRPARYHGAVVLFRASHSATEIAKRVSPQQDGWSELAPALRQYAFQGQHHEAISASPVGRFFRRLGESQDETPPPGDDDSWQHRRRHRATASE